MKNMLKRCYFLVLTAILLSACAHHAQNKPLPVQNVAGKRIQETRVPAFFSEVDIKGQIDVTLHTGYRKPAIVLTGDPRDLAQVQTRVAHSMLFVALGKGYPRFGKVHADIRGRDLDKISYEGAGFVTGTKLNTRFLDLYLQNQGTTRLGGSLGLHNLVVSGDGLTQLDGVWSRHLSVVLEGNPKVRLTGANVVLANLDINGSGYFSLYWVNSDNLIIRAKKAAKIQLAGLVNRLDVELRGRSEFKGRYLRAQRSFVKTFGHSVAEISAVNHQSNLASDASDIYYFNLPLTRADFMAFDGSVLDMRPWNQWDIQDFTRYNKQFP